MLHSFHHRRRRLPPTVHARNIRVNQCLRLHVNFMSLIRLVGAALPMSTTNRPICRHVCYIGPEILTKARPSGPQPANNDDEPDIIG
jgi:hypothetical protein